VSNRFRGRFADRDATGAPLDGAAVAHILLAARAAQIPALVRVSDVTGVGLALDCGADGVIVPHIRSAEWARRAVAAYRYAGGRGYSNSPRAGGYGAVSLGESSADTPLLREAVGRVVRAATAAGLPAMAPAPSVEGSRWLQKLGVARCSRTNISRRSAARRICGAGRFLRTDPDGRRMAPR
jgi:hypothetical protein